MGCLNLFRSSKIVGFQATTVCIANRCNHSFVLK
jgi:hypothetical protein